MDKADSIREQKGNVSREMGNLTKNQEMLEIENTITEMKNDCDRLIYKLDIKVRKESELDVLLGKTSKTEKKKGQDKKKNPILVGQLQKV